MKRFLSVHPKKKKNDLKLQKLSPSVGVQFDLGAGAMLAQHGRLLRQHKVGHRGGSLVGRCRQGARTQPLWYSQLISERLMLEDGQGKWRQGRAGGREGRRQRSAAVRFDSVTACGGKGGKGRWGKEGGDVMFTDLFLILSLAPVSPAFVPHVFCLISPPASFIASYLLLFAFCHRLSFHFPHFYLCSTPVCCQDVVIHFLLALPLLSPSCHFFPPPSPAPALLYYSGTMPSHTPGASCPLCACGLWITPPLL